MKKDKIAILIPCYNEVKTIKNVIRELKKEIPQATIYVYDNNSTDGTDIIAKNEKVIVRYEKRQGKGNVIKRFFEDVIADCYLMIDGDNTYSCKNAKEMCNLILKDKYDMVIGNRLTGTYFKENNRLFHNFGNKFVLFLLKIMFNSQIKDAMSGFRTFSPKFVNSFNIQSKEFEIETEMCIFSIENDMKVHQIDIGYRNRPKGSYSKLKTIKDGKKVIKTIFRFFKYYKPKKFYNLLGFINMIISIVSLIIIIKLPHNIFFYIIPITFMFIAILLFITGEICNTIKFYSSRNFNKKENEK